MFIKINLSFSFGALYNMLNFPPVNMIRKSGQYFQMKLTSKLYIMFLPMRKEDLWCKSRTPSCEMVVSESYNGAAARGSKY